MLEHDLNREMREFEFVTGTEVDVSSFFQREERGVGKERREPSSNGDRCAVYRSSIITSKETGQTLANLRLIRILGTKPKRTNFGSKIVSVSCGSTLRSVKPERLTNESNHNACSDSN